MFKLTLLALGLLSPALADVSIIIEEPIGAMGEFTSSGHAALYFSNICAESAISLRLCREGEDGAVVSTYQDLGDIGGHKWLALPFVPFMYGVTTAEEIPLYANGEIQRALQERYRKEHLHEIIPGTSDGSLPHGHWSQLIASGLRRNVYSLTVKTTPEQDAHFLAEFAQRPNEYDFNVLSNNCADFVSETMNLLFPGSTHRDRLNDFRVMTPKAVAHSFSEFASSRPELMFRVNKYSQIDQTVPESLGVRNLTEKTLVSKKYLILVGVTQPAVLGVFAGLYLATGRFNLDAEYREYASKAAATDQAATGSAEDATGMSKRGFQKSVNSLLRRGRNERSDRTRHFGTDVLWDGYKLQMEQMVDAAIQSGLFSDREEVLRFQEDLEKQSAPGFDSHGRLILTVRTTRGEREVGITRGNILNPESDRVVAYKLLLTKLNNTLRARQRRRSTVAEFQQDWALLEQLSKEMSSIPEEEGHATQSLVAETHSGKRLKKAAGILRDLSR